MKTLGQTSNTFDIYVDATTGQLAMADGINAYRLVLEDAIRNCRGELQLDIERGVPHFETIFKSVNGIDIWKSDVRKLILGYEFVESIDSFNVEVDEAKKILNYELIVNTDIGPVSVLSNDPTGPVDDGGGEDMGGLIQDGNFYLPVWKRDGVQYYRLLTDAIEPGTDLVATDISETLYIKVDGRFEPAP